MAAATKTIDGKVVGLDGAGAGGGAIKITPVPLGATVDDTGTEQVVGSIETAVIQADGSVNFDLIPTEAMTTASGEAAIYRFNFNNGGATWVEYIALYLADADPINIGNLTRIIHLPGGGGGGGALLWTRYTEVGKPTAIAGNAGVPYRVKDPGANEYAEIILEDGAGGFEYVPFAAF